MHHCKQSFEKVTLKVSIKVIRRSKDQNDNNYLWHITYGYQGLWGVRLGSVRFGQVRLGYVRLHQVKLGQVRLSQVRKFLKLIFQCQMPQVGSTYGILPMDTKACGGLGQGQLGKDRLGQAGLGQVRLSQIRLG